MSRPNKGTHPVAATLLDRMEESAREAAQEIRDLRKDLAALEKALKAKGKTEYPLLDIVHSAFEIHRRAGDYFLCKSLLAEMDDETRLADAMAYLEQHGASELRKPPGWHWISPKGEMHRLAPTGEPAKAAAVLEKLLSPPAKTPPGRKRAKAASPSGGKTEEKKP